MAGIKSRLEKLVSTTTMWKPCSCGYRGIVIVEPGEPMPVRCPLCGWPDTIIEITCPYDEAEASPTPLVEVEE